jgi:hypothetical protein
MEHSQDQVEAELVVRISINTWVHDMMQMTHGLFPPCSLELGVGQVLLAEER